jgi:hypothetical protein
MKITIPRILLTGLMGTALLVPAGSLRADDKDRDKKERSYRDKKHNDEHHWDDREDKAFRMYTEQNHRRYKDFHSLRERDQQDYWNWRHDHSDSLLNIEIH